MVQIIYLDQNGSRTQVDAAPGTSLMQAAVRNGVRTIEGECGGALACATCHVHIPDEWRATTGEASSDEREMLEFGIGVDARSRLACQVPITEAMNGMVVLTPVSQR